MWPFTSKLSKEERESHNRFVEDCNQVVDEIAGAIHAWHRSMVEETPAGSSLYAECAKANKASTAGLDMSADIEEIRGLYAKQIDEILSKVITLEEYLAKAEGFFKERNAEASWPKNTRKTLERWKSEQTFEWFDMVKESLTQPDALRNELGAHLLNMFVSGSNVASTLVGGLKDLRFQRTD